jgi:sialic acid synthase SpsE
MAVVIAELCQNHRGDIKTLKEMVWAAAEAGADYAKIQSMLADDLVYRKRFEEGKVENGKVLVIKRPYKPEFERLKPMDLDDAAHWVFVDECKAAGIKPLTTVFSRSRIPFLSGLPWGEIKVPSYDCASFPMIKELKERFKHLFISTGATHDHEIEETARILKGKSFTFLHCTTVYPTPLNLLNLARMDYLRKFTPSVGFSDHTLVERDGLKASIAALYFGADTVERHFTVLDRKVTKDGPISVDKTQLKELVEYSKMKKSELEKHAKKIPELQQTIGAEQPGLSHEELINRDYYRGRFASRVGGKIVFNWEDKRVF